MFFERNFRPLRITKLGENAGFLTGYIYWGAGDRAGHLAGGIRHPGRFAILVPRELDPVAAGERMPLPPEKP